ncbi:MAG: uncharacterized protein A8A55_1487 [Amphiamblys sp. WSBS2006]|nr:MAG: uncharacterized protein A8A55_1487 [Amphiamblys sp. WSBS2006]
MIDLAHKSFAKHRDSFFLEESGGVLIVSETVLEKERDDIQKKKEFLFSKRQKVLEVAKQRVLDKEKEEDPEKHKALEASCVSDRERKVFSSTKCLVCGGSGESLLPLCEEERINDFS